MAHRAHPRLPQVSLVLVRAFFATVPAVQASLVCIILTVSLATQLASRPFVHKLENAIENVSLFDHALVVLLGIVFLSLTPADIDEDEARHILDAEGVEQGSDISALQVHRAAAATPMRTDSAFGQPASPSV